MAPARLARSLNLKPLKISSSYDPERPGFTYTVTSQPRGESLDREADRQDPSRMGLVAGCQISSPKIPENIKKREGREREAKIRSRRASFFLSFHPALRKGVVNLTRRCGLAPRKRGRASFLVSGLRRVFLDLRRKGD